ncbi:hypothetical protein [Xylophilus sp.]|uniref:hypothetical protein n=1 Tax=Xylophilus sp. TaxID=2653893 RepID=UPI0013BBD68F|nr:hypothetical protein [Xylophilus sp.]KAF1044343.1 MAG: hypothetical protein GAK38_03580 [Xylophilus sp.]
MRSSTLDYLDFDYSEDADGAGSFDALASVRPAQAEALRAEVATVLDWAAAAFPGGRAPLDEGGDWDADLSWRDDEGGWFTAQLVIVGTPAFCGALRERFGV